MHEVMGITRKNKNNYETLQKKNTCQNRHSIFFHALQTTKEKIILCKEFFDASLYTMVLMPLDFIQGLCNTTSNSKSEIIQNSPKVKV